MKKLVLFGAHGGLGGAITAIASTRPDLDLHRIPWSTAANWTDDQIAQWARTDIGPDMADVVFANGLTDPGMPREDLMASNFRFPQRVIDATRERAGLRYVTFGSVLEQMYETDAANAYFASKFALSGFIEDLAAQDMRRRLLHLRLHTLFGSPRPHEHMFIGQVFNSLRSNTAFEMTSGRQYRQYHHVDDMAHAIVSLLDRQWQASPIVAMNGEETFQLADLAKAVFEHFGKSELLKIGALPTPEHDVLVAPNYPPSKRDFLPFARPTIASLCAWLETLGAASTA